MGARGKSLRQAKQEVWTKPNPRHLLGKARDTKLAGMSGRLAEAIARTGPEWLALVPRAEHALRDED